MFNRWPTINIRSNEVEVSQLKKIDVMETLLGNPYYEAVGTYDTVLFEKTHSNAFGYQGGFKFASTCSNRARRKKQGAEYHDVLSPEIIPTALFDLLYLLSLVIRLWYTQMICMIEEAA